MKKMFFISLIAFIISSCVVAAKYVQTGIFDVRKVCSVVSFAILTFGSWKNGKK